MPEEILILWNAMHPAIVAGWFMETVLGGLDKVGLTAERVNWSLTAGALSAWIVLRWLRRFVPVAKSDAGPLDDAPTS